MSYVIRHGQPIEVDTLDTGHTPKRRKTFEVKFVMVPVQWITALSQAKNPGSWRLAMVILAEDFKRKRLGGEIVLSSQVTRMPQTTRISSRARIGKPRLDPTRTRHQRKERPEGVGCPELKVPRTTP